MSKKNSKTNNNPARPKRQEKRTNHDDRDNILRPGLFSVPRHGHVLMTKERRKGEERALVAKYLELADIALNNADEPENDAA